MVYITGTNNKNFLLYFLAMNPPDDEEDDFDSDEEEAEQYSQAKWSRYRKPLLKRPFVKLKKDARRVKGFRGAATMKMYGDYTNADLKNQVALYNDLPWESRIRRYRDQTNTNLYEATLAVGRGLDLKNKWGEGPTLMPNKTGFNTNESNPLLGSHVHRLRMGGTKQWMRNYTGFPIADFTGPMPTEMETRLLPLRGHPEVPPRIGMSYTPPIHSPHLIYEDRTRLTDEEFKSLIRHAHSNDPIRSNQSQFIDTTGNPTLTYTTPRHLYNERTGEFRVQDTSHDVSNRAVVIDSMGYTHLPH